MGRRATEAAGRHAGIPGIMAWELFSHCWGWGRWLSPAPAAPCLGKELMLNHCCITTDQALGSLLGRDGLPWWAPIPVSPWGSLGWLRQVWQALMTSPSHSTTCKMHSSQAPQETFFCKAFQINPTYLAGNI